MKTFKSSQRVIIIFLTLFIVMCCFLIVRLEIKAANLQSRLDEHHKSLENNKDVLENLDSFTRKVKNNGIIIDDKKVIVSNGKTIFELEGEHFKIAPSDEIQISYNLNLDMLTMYNKGAYISVGKIDLKDQGVHNGVFIRSPKNPNSIMIVEKQIVIGSREKGKMSRINVDADYIIMERDESIVRLNDNELIIESSGDINITSKNGNVNIKGKKVKVNE